MEKKICSLFLFFRNKKRTDPLNPLPLPNHSLIILLYPYVYCLFLPSPNVYLTHP